MLRMSFERTETGTYSRITTKFFGTPSPFDIRASGLNKIARASWSERRGFWGGGAPAPARDTRAAPTGHWPLIQTSTVYGGGY